MANMIRILMRVTIGFSINIHPMSSSFHTHESKSEDTFRFRCFLAVSWCSFNSFGTAVSRRSGGKSGMEGPQVPGL